jgi:hypothetical protein
VDEYQVRVAGLLTPSPRRPRVTVSVDTIGLSRNGPRVVGSQRLSSTPYERTVMDATVALLRSVNESASANLQSTVADVLEHSDSAGAVTRRSVQLLARVETVGGPVLLGTSTSDFTARLAFSGLADLPGRIGPAAEFRDLPVVIRPSVAAVLIAGAVFSLTSATGKEAARRLAGRRALPLITISAGGTVLVDRGVIQPPTGEEQSIWDHDSQRYVPDPLTRAGIHGSEVAFPDNALELVWCVEGLQRYHADGTVRLRCLAKVAGRWFLCTLTGKPIRLLRQVTGLHGPHTTVYTDSAVTTQSLVMASARTIEEKGHGRITED